MKKILIILTVAGAFLFCLAGVLRAQEMEITSSPNVVGSGARAMGVGGAFIAIADDATAASWNPAALIMLKEPESAVMVSYEDRERSGTGDYSANYYDFNYIAVSYPFTLLRRNMIISFNYQRLFDFNSEFENVAHDPGLPDDPPPFMNEGELPNGNDLLSKNITRTPKDLYIEQDVSGDIGALAPAFAVQITPELSAGFTLNFWMDGVINDGYEAKYKSAESGYNVTDRYFYEDVNDNGTGEETELLGVDEGSKQLFSSRTSIDRTYDLWGINANLGLLWSPNYNLSIGAVYKFPFTATADFDYEYEHIQKTYDHGDPADPDDDEWVTSPPARDSYERRYKIRFPAVYGMGAAWRFNDNFTMALDVSYTEWDKFIIQEYEKVGRSKTYPMGIGGDKYVPTKRTSAVNGLATGEADVDGVFTVRTGAEYLFILPKTIIPARVGFAYDPEPAHGSSDDFYAVTCGTGVMLWDRLIFDIAYQHRWSKSASVTQTNYEGELMKEYHHSVTQHQILLSSILHF